jgi:hypothetical protein
MNISELTELFTASIKYTPIKKRKVYSNAFFWSVEATFCGTPIEIFANSDRKKDIAEQVNYFIQNEVLDLFARYEWRDVDGACDLIDQMITYTTNK